MPSVVPGLPGLHLGSLDRALIEREIDVDPTWLGLPELHPAPGIR